MSRWFEHRHYWRPESGPHSVWDKAAEKPTAFFMVEDCRCGAVRTIEFKSGEAPIIRVAIEQKP